MIDTLESCFVVKSADKPQWLGECEFSAMEAYLGLVGVLLNDVDTSLPCYSFKDITPFINKIVSNLELIVETQLSRSVLEFDESKIEFEPICVNQFESLVSSNKLVLQDRASRLFNAIIPILTRSLKLFYMRPQMCIDVLSRPLNFRDPEMQTLYSRFLYSLILEISNLKDPDPESD